MNHAKSAPSVVVVGEALIDLVTYPGKAPVKYVGGSPLNVALGLGRLGNDVELVTALSEDHDAWRIRQVLSRSGVTLGPGCATIPRTPTASAEISLEGAASYSFDLEWDLPPLSPSHPVLHTGSLGVVVQPGSSAVFEIVRKNRPETIITLDPNVRSSLGTSHAVYVNTLEEFFRLSDVVKLSDEDAMWLYPSQSLDSVATHIQSLGPLVVALTCGSSGSFIYGGGQRHTIRQQNVTVTDTVGAGDSYMAGLLHIILRMLETGMTVSGFRKGGWIDEPSLRVLADFATKCSSTTVTRSGANLPWLYEVKP